jgi:hypothetical protein
VVYLWGEENFFKRYISEFKITHGLSVRAGQVPYEPFSLLNDSSWYLESGIRNPESGIWNLVSGIRYQVSLSSK